MPTTPNYGLRFPTLGDTPDAVRDFQALAEDTDAALLGVDQGVTAPYAQFTRTTTDSFSSGEMVNLQAATLSSAPAGLYLLSWRLILSGSATLAVGNLRILCNAINHTDDGRQDLDNAARHMSGSAFHSHAGGADLDLQAWFQVASGTGTIHADSWIGLARIGTTV